MPKKKRDGFDDLADFLRRRPVAALRAGRVLRVLYGFDLGSGDPSALRDRALEFVKAVQKLDGPEVVGSLLEDAGAKALAAKRKSGRPRKGDGPFDLLDALRNAADQRRIDEVADAIKSDLLRPEAVEAMRQAARQFSAKRSRPAAFEAMKRFRARLEEVEADPGKRTRDDRPRLLAARVVLEARGEPAEEKDGRRLLRRLQRGSVVRLTKLTNALDIAHAREEDMAGLLANMERSTKPLP